MVALILEVYMSIFIRGSKFSAPGILTIITTSTCPILYKENICLQTFLLLFICANHRNKRPFVSTATKVQVGGSGWRFRQEVKRGSFTFPLYAKEVIRSLGITTFCGLNLIKMCWIMKVI